MKYIDLKNYIEYLKINNEKNVSSIRTVSSNLLFDNLQYAKTYADAISNVDILRYRELWQFEELFELVKLFSFVTCEEDRKMLRVALDDAISVICSCSVSECDPLYIGNNINRNYKNKEVHKLLDEILQKCTLYFNNKKYDRIFDALSRHIGSKRFSRLKDNINPLYYDLIISVFGLTTALDLDDEVFDVIACLDNREEIALCENCLIIIKQLFLSRDIALNIFSLIKNKQFKTLENVYYSYVKEVPYFVNFEAQLDELAIKKDIYEDHLKSTLKCYNRVITSPLYEYTWVNTLEVLYPFKNRFINYELSKQEDDKIDVIKKKTTREKQIEQVSELINLGIPVMLIGPYGCGKQTLFTDAAKDYCLKAGKDLHFSSLDKFKNPDQFNDFYGFEFKNGGMFYLKQYEQSDNVAIDEMNSSIRYQVMNVMAQGDSLVSASNDFRLGVGVNTYDFSREVLCGETKLKVVDMDRYAVLDISYDDIFEQKVLEVDPELYSFIREFRDIASSKEIRHFITTRDVMTARKLIDSGKYSREDILKMVILKHLSIEALLTIEEEMSKVYKNSNSYSYSLSLILNKKQ